MDKGAESDAKYRRKMKKPPRNSENKNWAKTCWRRTKIQHTHILFYTKHKCVDRKMNGNGEKERKLAHPTKIDGNEIS